MKNENEKTALCPKCEKTLCLDLNNVSYGYDAWCVECDEDFYKCEFKYKENEKTQEVLANFTSEELIDELLTRNGDFLLVGNWYYKEHIIEYLETIKDYQDKDFNIEKAMSFIKANIETYHPATDDEYDIFTEIIDDCLDKQKKYKT